MFEHLKICFILLCWLLNKMVATDICLPPSYLMNVETVRVVELGWNFVMPDLPSWIVSYKMVLLNYSIFSPRQFQKL